MTGGAPALHVERRGQGRRTLVLLHGWALNSRVFDTLAATLERDFSLLALDLPGHGRSAEPDSLRQRGWTLPALAALALPQVPHGALLLGWSLGGQVALQLAHDAPGHVAGLVLVSTTPRFTQGDGWSQGVAPAVLAHFAKHLGSDYRATVQRILSLPGEFRLICVTVIPGGPGDANASDPTVEHHVRLRHWVEPLRLPAQRLSLHVIEGSDPAQAILDFARVNLVDLIVIGAPGPGEMKMAWWRSVASSVTANAACSVHVVRVPEERAG